jgi:8-oxo-dGTP pyrophosphatase MutT (NUDIX family)
MIDPAIAAATVVLLRNGPDAPELLLLERHRNTAFAGGAMVFPGGRVDPGDLAVVANPTLASGFADLDPVDAAARVAAARETLEEADVVLSHGPAIDPVLRADWRARLNANAATYGDFLAIVGHRLVPVGSRPPRRRSPAVSTRASISRFCRMAKASPPTGTRR